jgi:tRNA A-37 threonylcarbamoyl transferase component Bud32
VQSPFQEGSILRGKYRVERVLGQGGMGVVVAAWHLRLEQRVAIKILRPELIQNHEVVERFLREARAASKLEGDHVVRVTDVETLEDGTPFMVMEYLEGTDLAWVRERNQPLLPADAVDYILEACEAIAEAHAHGVIHRDIKPGNIFLARRRDGRTRIKVLDFGISKLADASGAGANLTATSAIMGSAEYMSPEQMQSSRDVDERTDIWALGVSLYELCTGRGAFEAPSLREVCVRVLANDPPPPRSIRPEIPPGLEAVILRCLNKDREQRYATIAALRTALLPFASGALAVAPGAPSAAPFAPPFAPSPPSSMPAPPVSPFASSQAAPQRLAPMAQPAAAHALGVQPLGAQPVAPSPRPIGLTVPLAVGAAALLVLIVTLAFVLGRGHGSTEIEGAASASPSASAPAGSGRYQLEAELVVDGKTGLRWQRRPPLGTMSFSSAKSYCASARGGSFRLPTQEELALLSRAARQNLASPHEVFTTAPNDYYWSSSPVEQDPKLLWIVRFGDGDVTTSSPSGTARVRCVR